jgi:hypothetical protein
MRARVLLAGLLAAVALVPTASTAQPQTLEPLAPPTLSGYDVQGRAGGLVVAYDIPGRLPLSPLVDVAVPDAQSSVGVGPAGSAIASLGYPGPLLLSLDTVFAQFGGIENPLPPYPFIVRAPTSTGTAVLDTTSVPGGRMEAIADGGRAAAQAVLPAKSTLPVLDLGTVDARSETTVAGGAATSHVRVQVDGIEIPGLLSVDSLVTDLEVSSNGEAVTQAGTTKLAGVRVLGREAVIDGNGIRFTKAEASAVAKLLAPLADGLGPLVDGLAPLLDGLGPATEGIGAILQGDPTGLQKVLEESGISVRLAQPRFTGTGSAGTLDGAGLVVAFDADLDETPLAQLVALFDLLPPLPEVPGLPLQPTDLVAAIRARHVGQLGIAAGRASVTAKLPSGRATDGGTGGTGGPQLGGTTGGFAPIQPPGFDSDPTATTPGARPAALRLPLGELVGWRMVLLGIAAALVASLFTRRLPDVALAAAQAGTCAPPTTKGPPP